MTDKSKHGGKGSHLIVAGPNGKQFQPYKRVPAGTFARFPAIDLDGSTQCAPDQPNSHLATSGTKPKSLEGLADAVARGNLVVDFDAETKDYFRRIADHFDPPPSDIVGTDYIAEKRGCGTQWVSDMARIGMIPVECLVEGSGNGRPWKFYRRKIDKWLASENMT